MLGRLAMAVSAAAAVDDFPRELREPWAAYVRAFVQGDGRVMDPATGNLTTSEGQALALVRAAWIGDRAVFDQVLRWTRDNLQGGDPGSLPAWKWGEAEDGTWRVLDPQPASDADHWMAWALVRASRRWNAPAYLEQALAILDRSWAQETVEVGGRTLFAPGPWAVTQEGPARLNPSYWLTFAWRDFALVDAGHPWAELIPAAYECWERTRLPSGLPPDWAWLDRQSGERVPPPPGDEGKEVFGFEAFRLAWTLAAERSWYGDPRADPMLRAFGQLSGPWRASGRVAAIVDAHGAEAVDYEYPGMYGALLPAWGIVEPAAARALYAREIRPRREAHGWGDAADYYGQNWVWLGIALWKAGAPP